MTSLISHSFDYLNDHFLTITIGSAVVFASTVYFASRQPGFLNRTKFRLYFWWSLWRNRNSKKPPSQSLESASFAWIFGNIPKSTIPTPADIRKVNFDRLGALQSIHPGVTVKPPILVPVASSSNGPNRTHVPVYLMKPSVSLSGQVILYLHAGTYISGSIKSHKGFVSQLCNQTHRAVYFVDYCLGPQYPVPNCVPEVVSAYKWIIEQQNCSPKDIVFVGDSAGGGLALLVLLELKKQSIDLPSGAWLMSPWTDLSCGLPSWQDNLKHDVMLNRLDFRPGSVTMEHATGLKNSTAESLKNPAISPLFAPVESFTGLPPMLIQAGGYECLLSDSIEMGLKLKEAGIPVTLQVCEHQQHIFQLFYDWIPEARAALDTGCEWINSIKNN